MPGLRYPFALSYSPCRSAPPTPSWLSFAATDACRCCWLWRSCRSALFWWGPFPRGTKGPRPGCWSSPPMTIDQGIASGGISTLEIDFWISTNFFSTSLENLPAFPPAPSLASISILSPDASPPHLFHPLTNLFSSLSAPPYQPPSRGLSPSRQSWRKYCTAALR